MKKKIWFLFCTILLLYWKLNLKDTKVIFYIFISKGFRKNRKKKKLKPKTRNKFIGFCLTIKDSSSWCRVCAFYISWFLQIACSGMWLYQRLRFPLSFHFQQSCLFIQTLFRLFGYCFGFMQLLVLLVFAFGPPTLGAIAFCDFIWFVFCHCWFLPI